MYSVPSPRWLWVATGTAPKMRSTSSAVKPSASSRSRERPSISPCAHGHAVMPWARTPMSRRVPCADATAEPSSVYISCVRMPDSGRRLVLGVAGGDRHLGPSGVLALAHALGDVLGEGLGLEGRLAEDDLADDVVGDLLEARHVRALLVGAQIDEAVELCVVEPLVAVVADADDLLDAGDADAGQRQGKRGLLLLDVGL